MSNSNKFTDRTPFIKEAGHTTAISGLSADVSLRQDLYCPRGSTPEHIKKYRKSEKEVIGTKQVHYGIYDDDRSYENSVHGVKTMRSDHVDDCIKGKNLNGVSYFLNNIKEQKYASAKREPLGSGLQRNYIFPDKVQEPGFKFGNATKGCKFS